MSSNERKWISSTNQININGRSILHEDNMKAFLQSFVDTTKKFNEKKSSFINRLESVSISQVSTDKSTIHDAHFNHSVISSKFETSANKLNDTEKEKLYCEIIYTIKHKIGCTIDGHSDYILGLYKYAQDAFGYTNEQHDRLFELICEEKPPILIVNVEVMEAKHLEAKDANGFSDPYCMLGIIPGQRNTTIEERINEDDEDCAGHLQQSNYNRLPSNRSIASNNNFNLNKMSTSPNFNLKGGKSPDQQAIQQQQHSPTHSTSSTCSSQSPISASAQSSSKSSFIKRLSSFRRSEKSGSMSHASTNLTSTAGVSVHSTSQAITQIDKHSDVFAAAPQCELKANSSHHFSFHHSHNRKNSESSYQIGAIRDLKLPAKFIKTTDVKKATLSPKWNEKFQFQIDDINSDTFHLDIWDHDDEFSVFEAAKKLNEVKGFKGLDRYFKQIAQSARAHLEDNSTHVDDFLGSVNIRLNELPSSGIDKWFDLEGRSEKSNVEGQIRLRLKLATREDRGNSQEEDNWNDLKQREKLLSIFIDYELSKLYEKKSYEWRGELSREAETVLHQHAIQGDITDFQIAICDWIAFSKKHMSKELSYKILFDKLQKLDNIWNTSSPSRDESEYLRESFQLFIHFCFKSIENLRDVFPVKASVLNLDKLELILKILVKLFDMNAFKQCCPFQNPLIHELANIIKNATNDWFQRTLEKSFKKSDDDVLNKLISLAQAINNELYVALKYYNPIFEKCCEFKVNYFTLVFKTVDSKLIELVQQTLIEEYGEEIKNFVGDVESIYGLKKPINDSATYHSSPSMKSRTYLLFNYNMFTEQVALSLFELYINLLSIYEYKSHLSEIERESLKFNSYPSLFYLPFKHWIELIKQKVEIKVEKSFECEKNDVLTELTKFTSTSVEVCTCFTQISHFFKLIKWPEYLGSLMFYHEMVECITKAVIRYATLVRDKHVTLLSSAINQQNKEKEAQIMLSDTRKVLNTSKEMDAYQKVIIAVNNVERVRESLNNFLNELELNDFIERIKQIHMEEESHTYLEMHRVNLQDLVNQTNEFMVSMIDLSLELVLNNKINFELESHLFYLFESPESATAFECISRVIEYFDDNLAFYRELAFKVNFERILKIAWLRILTEIQLYLKKDTSSQRTIVFFVKMSEAMDILVDFFNADNQGLPKDYMIQCERFKDLKKYFRLQSMETSKLIQLYYQEMNEIQKSLKSDEFGSLVCRACYHPRDETLLIEIFKCRNLLPMDQNGLSDPFVEVELKPHFFFGNYEKKTTAIIKKTLNPIFNEIFEFKVPEPLCLKPGTMIHFTVMDHDLVWTNDFEGEAFLELNSLPGVRGDLGDGYKNLKYVELPLIRPKNHPSLIIDVLEYRAQDKLASEFLKIRKDKLNK